MYQYLFYLYYRFFFNISRKNMPEANAILVLSILFSFYLFIFYALITSATGGVWRIPRLLIVVIYFIIFIFHYILFVRKKRYRKIYTDYRQKIHFTNRFGTLIALGYLIIPFLFIIFYPFNVRL
jgi:hypothetical protein